MIADMKVKANLIQLFAPVFFLPVVVIDLGQDSESRCESEWSGMEQAEGGRQPYILTSKCYMYIH